MATKITTYACGCSDRERLNWNHTADQHVTEAAACYHCRVIAPRPAIGSTAEFLRFGPPPASGKSRNGRDGFNEIGVSAYAIMDGKLVKAPGLLYFLDRPAFRGTGRVVGYGSDDEILVKVLDIRPISEAEADTLTGYGS